jgi:ferrous iron transport protein A
MRPATRLALDDIPLRQPHRITELSVPAHAPAWAQWLEEIGCFPGEPVAVLARGVPGGDPLVVRIGHSTFALRRAEAACIRVAPLS